MSLGSVKERPVGNASAAVPDLVTYCRAEHAEPEEYDPYSHRVVQAVFKRVSAKGDRLVNRLDPDPGVATDEAPENSSAPVLGVDSPVLCGPALVLLASRAVGHSPGHRCQGRILPPRAALSEQQCVTDHCHSYFADLIAGENPRQLQGLL